MAILDLKSFKKIASDKETTTLQHADGHTIKVVHSALSKPNRKSLEALPVTKMALGGILPNQDVAPVASTVFQLAKGGKPKDGKSLRQKFADGGDVADKGPKIDPEKAKQIQDGANQSGFQPATWAKNLKSGLGFAEGGAAEPTVDSNGKLVGKLADLPQSNEAESSPENLPVAANPDTDTPPTPDMSAPNGPVPPGVSPDANTDPVNNPFTQAPEASAPPISAGPPDETPDPSTQLAKLPTSYAAVNHSGGLSPNSAYDPAQGLAAGNKAADVRQNAESHLAQDQAAIAEQRAQGEQTINQRQADQTNKFMQESGALIEDMKNSKVDPNRYMNSMSTGKRISTAIGLLLGGIGGGLLHQENPALKYVESQINNDIDAQKANIANKSTIYQAMLHQYGNERDATDAARLHMGNMFVHQMDEAALKQGTPLAQARALDAKNQIAQQYGPMLQSLSMRRAMFEDQQAAGSHGGLSSTDPALYVPGNIPTTDQDKVFGEIKAAQNTVTARQHILNAFDQAAKDYTGLINKAESVFKTPRSVGALHTFMGPTFADTEGTVRQAAMDNVFSGITPKATDNADDLKTKRAALIGYLQSKQSAPIAKGHGMDLSRYGSTSLATPQAAQQAAGPQIKVVNGIKYMRGPNGEAVKVN